MVGAHARRDNEFKFFRCARVPGVTAKNLPEQGRVFQSFAKGNALVHFISEVANVPSQQGANLMARAKKRRAWTAQDVRVLKTHSKNKTSVKAISRTMKRTPAAVRQKAAALGIPIGHSR